MFDIKKGNGKFHSKTVHLTLLMNTYILRSTTLTKFILSTAENAKAEVKPKTECQSCHNLCDTSWTCQTPQRWRFNYGTSVERYLAGENQGHFDQQAT